MITDTTIHNATVMLAFLQRNKQFVGPVAALNIGCHVAPKIQIDADSPDKDKASGLLGCLYQLGGQIQTHTNDEDVFVSVQTPYGDEIGGAYATFKGTTATYLLSLPEVTAHSLRRIQVGDVPKVVAA